MVCQTDLGGPIEIARKKKANELPVSAGRFILMFRFYWPKDGIINGTWKPPAVTAIPQILW
jgi:hypothetical protein